MKIGIIKEGKIPQDTRVALNPIQCAFLIEKHHVNIVVQSSPIRAFSDDEYRSERVPVVENVEDCDVLLGVKEVPIDQLIPNKKYFFFSHTIKKQEYNRKLLQEILKRNIQLVDYEVLTNSKGSRLIAFGKFAGMVGAHNALWTYGKKKRLFELPRLHKLKEYAEVLPFYKKINWPAMKVVLTGGGRVAKGAVKVLEDMGFTFVSPKDFLSNKYDYAVFTQLLPKDYVERKDGAAFNKKEFYTEPKLYQSCFLPFTKVADIFINGIYWDPQAPAFFTVEDMQSDDFHLSVIADVTADIAPDASVPSTIRPSTIEDPVYGIDLETNTEVDPFQENTLDVMAIDNLPNELPRDASTSFGEQFIEHIWPCFVEFENNPIINGASIAINGELGAQYKYLQDFVEQG